MQQAPALFPGRKLRLSYWNAGARVVASETLGLERHLARLGEVKLTSVKTLEDAGATQYDLLIVAAQLVSDDDFPQWLAGLRGRIQAHGSIWTPALILADVPFETLSDILPEVTKDNWYFDILAPAHLSSLPMRVANLLRIHDHLHELKRYAAALDDISAKVALLEAQMGDLGKAESAL